MKRKEGRKQVTCFNRVTQQSQSATKELEVVDKNEQLIKSSIGIFEGTKDKCLGKLKQVKEL